MSKMKKGLIQDVVGIVEKGIDQLDDKAGVIIVLGIIAIVAMYSDLQSNDEIVRLITSGLLGMATGKAMR